MGKTVRDVLVRTLEDLEKKSLKKFKNKLNDWEIKEGYSSIPRGKLEDADTEDVADLIMNYYTDSYGIKVTLEVLEAVDEKQKADKLRNDLKTVGGRAFQEPTKKEDQGATSRDEKHFADRHRAELISRVSLVDPILDDLYNLLTPEAYERVRSMGTSQEKMRELFRHINSWGNKDKDLFLQSLRKYNGPLLKDLQER
ncbi:apoptosis-associated speck-like protein containing a CARD [Rhinoderma darwinii]|uniref:apoptosis-associated speck-like protein containing a CARD n=1 Tax=Rhinoderma darwinii TaxID=43563 RepID=UPI003F680C33